MRRLVLLFGLGLAACAAPAAPPAGARPDLGREWVEAGGYRWPPGHGFDAPAAFLVLPPGVLLDRFGGEGGRFFSPKGAAFRARALPSVCRDLPYAAYRVLAPLPVRIGAALPWFGEPGGATQVMTDATAAQLLADGVLERLPADAAPCP
ncbi:TNT domain-containing protein [Falsiroseomonas sp. CW058]|uniref:TNT domain-containing protein n=1 Tax=Falsiroseomonas sp. CW058 TaxID=3388664 RepID=UPI003D31C0E7